MMTVTWRAGASALTLIAVAHLAQAEPLKVSLPGDGAPPSAGAEACLARVQIGRSQELVSREVVVRPGYERVSASPAEFVSTRDEIVIEDGRTEYLVTPAEYDTVTERVLVRPAYQKFVIKDPEFRTYTETVAAGAPIAEWAPETTASAAALDPTTGRVFFRTQLPSGQAVVDRQALVTAADVEVIEVPAAYEDIERRVLVRPASVTERVVPPTTRSVETQSLVAPAELSRNWTPPVTQTVQTPVASGPERFAWVSVVCADEASEAFVAALQSRLLGVGHDPGPIDGVYGPRTRAALRAYQRAAGLGPVGFLTRETARRLGVNPADAPASPSRAFALGEPARVVAAPRALEAAEALAHAIAADGVIRITEIDPIEPLAGGPLIAASAASAGPLAQAARESFAAPIEREDAPDLAFAALAIENPPPPAPDDSLDAPSALNPPAAPVAPTPPVAPAPV
ncbi:MAG: peptidoglycan-binding protein, partial [Maricaulaceae bacterium]